LEKHKPGGALLSMPSPTVLRLVTRPLIPVYNKNDGCRTSTELDAISHVDLLAAVISLIHLMRVLSPNYLIGKKSVECVRNVIVDCFVECQRVLAFMAVGFG
jgi:hypothetical protein